MVPFNRDLEILRQFNEKAEELKNSQVCRTVHGEEFAEKCISKIKENGYINPVQRYFGLHYCADETAPRNDEFLKIMEEFGFGWFKKYRPLKEQAT